MSLSDFWHGDIRLLSAYQKAYIRDKSYTAWVFGNYSMFATERGVRNAMATKTSEIDRKWIKWEDPLEKIPRKKQGSKDNNIEHHNQQLWFFDTFYK